MSLMAAMALAREQPQVNALHTEKMQWYHYAAIYIVAFILAKTCELFCHLAVDFLERRLGKSTKMQRYCFIPIIVVMVLPLIMEAYFLFFVKSLVSVLLFCALLQSLSALCAIYRGYVDVASPIVKFSAKPSSKGGNDIQIAYYSIDVLKCFSAPQPLIPMVLYAAEIWSKFSYSKTLSPKCVVSIFEKSLSSAPSKSSNAGAVPEFSSTEASGRSNQPSGSVIDLSTLKKATITFSATPRARDLDHGDSDKIRVTMNMESNSAPAIFSSSETTPNHMVNELCETGLESYSDPDSGAVERSMEAKTGAAWIVATAAPHHATGNRDLLTDFTMEGDDIFVSTADGAAMQVPGRGNVVTDAVILPDVWYIPGLSANLVSVSQLGELDYSVGFGRSACYVRSNSNDAVVGEAHIREDGLFKLDFLKINLSM